MPKAQVAPSLLPNRLCNILPAEFLPIPPINGMPLCKLKCAGCIVHSNGDGTGSNPLKPALVGFVFNHWAHVLSGTCGGLKGAGAGLGLHLHWWPAFFLEQRYIYIYNKTQPLHREVSNYYEFTRGQEGYGRSPVWVPATGSGGGEVHWHSIQREGM